MPAKVAVRPARKACTPRRTPASARRIDSSAVRCACRDVSPRVTPSTPATDSVAAMKILAPRPSRAGLVALASGIRRVVFAVLVLVGHPAEAARVELQLDPRSAGRRDAHRTLDLRAALVPGVQHPRARRHGGDFEAASAAAWVKWLPAMTCTNATIRGWMLQKTRTKPGFVNVQVLASPRPYCPTSKGLGPEAENTLWSKGS